jgi:hypothetical protein
VGRKRSDFAIRNAPLINTTVVKLLSPSASSPLRAGSGAGSPVRARSASVQLPQRRAPPHNFAAAVSYAFVNTGNAALTQAHASELLRKQAEEEKRVRAQRRRSQDDALAAAVQEAVKNAVAKAHRADEKEKEKEKEKEAAGPGEAAVLDPASDDMFMPMVATSSAHSAASASAGSSQAMQLLRSLNPAKSAEALKAADETDKAADGKTADGKTVQDAVQEAVKNAVSKALKSDAPPSSGVVPQFQAPGKSEYGVGLDKKGGVRAPSPAPFRSTRAGAGLVKGSK